MSYLFCVHIVLAIVMSGLLLTRPYLRITSMGWFVGIWLVPILGPLFFLLLVIRLRRHKVSSVYQALRHQHNAAEEGFTQANFLAESAGFLPYYASANVQLQVDDEFIEHLFSAIDQAGHHIWITTYILSGTIKEQLIERLQAANGRGVEIRLLVDRLGSGLFRLSKKTQALYNSLPFETQIFHPTLRKSLLFIEKRLHAKIVTIDGKSAFIGSHNLRDEVIQSDEGAVHNLSVFFQGKVVQQLEALFVDLWPGEDKNEQVLRRQCLEQQEVIPGQDGVGRIFFSDPINRTINYDGYLGALFVAARKQILIWMPYMIPSQTMRNVLIAQSQRGVDVRVLIPKKTDSVLVDNTHQLILNELVNNGVKCALSEGRFDHSKVMIIDDQVVVGSTNMDYRSLFRNYEANIEMQNPAILTTLTDHFNQRFEAAEKVEYLHIGTVKNMLYQFTSLIAGLY